MNFKTIKQHPQMIYMFGGVQNWYLMVRLEDYACK